MAKKSDNPVENELVQDRDIIEEMEESSLNYAIKTIVDRALPDVRDGLKPVLRRILYTMYKKGLTPDKIHVKNADIVGETMGKYHPHGDGSIYGVLVNASQNFNYRYPVIDFQGNNGSLDGDPAAAYRYTESKLDKKALLILQDVDKESVQFKPNYSETTEEPVVLPSLFPTLLVNGISGIATGYTTDIPSHNLSEVVDAIIAQIKNPEILISELLKHIKGPDFAIGGQLIYNDNVRKLYETGSGSLLFRGTFFLEENEDSGNTQIVFNSLPPDENKPKLVEKLYNLCCEQKVIPRVVEVRDESYKDEKDIDVIRIVIELHKTAVPDIVISEIFNKTKLEKTTSYIMRALVNQAPDVLNLKSIIQHYIEHRRSVVEGRTHFDLNKAKARLHILEGYKKILDDIDNVIKIIRNSDSTEEASNNLKQTYLLSDVQVKSILDMPLRRLTKLEENKIVDDINKVQAEIAGYEHLLSTQIEIDKVIIDELRKLKKDFGDARRTSIVLESELNNSANSLSTDEEMAIILTSKDALKQIPMGALQELQKGGFLREKQEYFLQATKGTVVDEYVLILETGDYVNVSFNDLLSNMSFLENKKIKAIVKKEQEIDKVIHLVTKKGYIIKSLMKNFKARQRRVAPFIKFKETGDEIVGVKVSDGDIKNVITIVTDQGVVHRFFEKAFTTSNPGGNGVPCIGESVIKEDKQEIIDFAISNGDEDDSYKVLLYLEDAQGIGLKTMCINEFKPKGRVSKGIIGTEFRGKGKSKVHKMKLAKEDFFVIDSKGKIYNHKFVSVVPQNRYNKPVDNDFIPAITDFFIE